MRKVLLPLSVIALAVAILLSACQKEANGDADGTNNGGTHTLKIRLTDAPVDADQVNVDIQQVRVYFSSDSLGWVDLNTNTGIYDLLGLQNGVDTLLATGIIPADSVQELRFVLGSNNTIMVDSVIYPLTIPSGEQSGLKLKINRALRGPVDSLLIDFDAAMSVHQTGSGKYMLKPVLKIK